MTDRYHPIRKAKRKKKIFLNEKCLRDLWDNIKHIIIFTIELPEGEERKKGPEKNI